MFFVALFAVVLLVSSGWWSMLFGRFSLAWGPLSAASIAAIFLYCGTIPALYGLVVSQFVCFFPSIFPQVWFSWWNRFCIKTLKERQITSTLFLWEKRCFPGACSALSGFLQFPISSSSLAWCRRLLFLPQILPADLYSMTTGSCFCTLSGP